MLQRCERHSGPGQEQLEQKGMTTGVTVLMLCAGHAALLQFAVLLWSYLSQPEALHLYFSEVEVKHRHNDLLLEQAEHMHFASNPSTYIHTQASQAATIQQPPDHKAACTMNLCRGLCCCRLVALMHTQPTNVQMHSRTLGLIWCD